jgi:hypothetical protein
MVSYRCDNCFKVYFKKSHYKAHLARKNKCEAPSDSDDDNEKELHQIAPNVKKHQKPCTKLHQNAPIILDYEDKKIETKEINDEKDIFCKYCNKSFVTNYSLNRHLNGRCKEKDKKIEQENAKKDEILKKLLDEMLIIKKQNESLQKEMNELKSSKLNHQEIKNSYNENCNNINNNDNSNNNSNNNINNGVVDNRQQIVLVNYNNEDLSKININKFIKILRRGFQAPVELTKAVHFDPNLPEYHNVFIPKWNERIAMCYKDNKWKVMDKNILVEDIYENKRAYIIEKWEDFSEKLTEAQKKALNRWLTSEDEKDDKILKDDIKKVLYENRGLGFDSQERTKQKNKEMQSLYDENTKKIERKKFMPKKEDE